MHGRPRERRAPDQGRDLRGDLARHAPRPPRRPSSRPRPPRRSRARRAAPGARSSGRSDRRRRPPPAARRRSRRRRRACCRPAGRDPARRRSRGPTPSGQGQVRVPDVDRHPAAALLRQPVRVDAGEGAQQRRSCRGRCDRPCRRRRSSRRYRQRRATMPASRRTSTSSSDRLDRPEVEHELAVLDPGEDPVRAATEQGRGARPATARRHGDAERRQHLPRQRPAAHRRLERDDRLRGRPRRLRPPRGSHSARDPERQRRPGRSSARRGCRSPPGRPGRCASVAATPARIALSGRIARASGSRRSLATRSAPSHDRARPAARRPACRR